MMLGEEHYITSWFRIAFIENEGMAYGITLGSKLFLTLFRVIAMSGLLYYFFARILPRFAQSKGFLICIVMILAGGWGNVIDSVIYGAIFTESTRDTVAQLVPWGEGYSSILYGNVVDMLYFPLIEGTFPSWIPWWGGEDFLFFRPIFNLADSFISVGVALLLICYPRTLSLALEGEKK